MSNPMKLEDVVARAVREVGRWSVEEAVEGRLERIIRGAITDGSQFLMSKLRASAKASSWRWRVQGDVPIDVSSAGAFDEIVVGRWLHAEMLDDDSATVSVGPLQLWVAIDDQGVGSITHAEGGDVIGDEGLRRQVAVLTEERDNARAAEQCLLRKLGDAVRQVKVEMDRSADFAERSARWRRSWR